jgi:hypothetical protein
MSDQNPRTRDVTASEIGCYAYCAKAWHLEHVLRQTPSKRARRRRVAGIDAHERDGARVQRLSSPPRVPILVFGLVLIALLLASLAWILG